MTITEIAEKNYTLTILTFFSFRNGLFVHISEQRQALEQLIHWTLLVKKYVITHNTLEPKRLDVDVK